VYLSGYMDQGTASSSAEHTDIPSTPPRAGSGAMMSAESHTTKPRSCLIYLYFFSTPCRATAQSSFEAFLVLVERGCLQRKRLLIHPQPSDIRGIYSPLGRLPGYTCTSIDYPSDIWYTPCILQQTGGGKPTNGCSVYRVGRNGNLLCAFYLHTS
jgi:hypothetical protein